MTCMKTEVVNCKHDKYDVYCGRPSIWGNPYQMGGDGNREEVIAKYKVYIASQSDLLSKLGQLRGKRLGCFCRPNECHCCILLDLIEEKFGGKRLNKFELIQTSKPN